MWTTTPGSIYWKKYCEVNIGTKGQEKFENVDARFTLALDCGVHTSKVDPSRPDFDLVRFCGTHQREQSSREYLQDLERIAALDGSLPADQPGVDIEVPVKVCLSIPEEQTEALMDLGDVGTAERMINQQWEEYRHKQGKQDGVASGSLRCTFVLEPMQVNFHDVEHTTTPELAETLARMLRGNVCFSRFWSFSLVTENIDPEDTLLSRKVVGQLMRSLFDSTRALTDSHYRLNDFQGPRPLQLGVVEVYGSEETLDSSIAALNSALVLNQMTKTVALHFGESPFDATDSIFWYKWLAYDIFSSRARRNSALETLHLLLGEMTVESVEAFSAVLNSAHPEEDVCGRPRGEIDERDATLPSGAPIRWIFDENGEYDTSSRVLSFPEPVDPIRTFSDDGRSQWVDALVAGFGRCQVRRGDLAFHQIDAVDTAPPPTLLSLTVGFCQWDDAATDGLPYFLKTIGPSLRSLTLWGARVDLEESEILQWCPNLEELSLSGTWIDVQLNFAEYRKSGQPLPELPPTNWHEIAAVSKALSNMDNQSIQLPNVYDDYEFV